MPAVDPVAILEALDEPALLVRSGTVAIANSAAVALFGRSIRGSDVRLAIRHPQALELIQSGAAADREITGIGGIGRSWLLSVRPLEARSMLVRLADRSAARAAERMRVDFVANASHELRTPLTTILGFAETMAEDPGLEPKDYSRFAGIICGEARRMQRIVDDLISLSRIEADRFLPPSETVLVEELIDTALEQTTSLATGRACVVQQNVEPGLPAIAGDRAQLLQLLDNLISNAIRYGCGERNCTVTVSAHGERNGVLLSVSDDGQGIASEHLPRLTERFYRVDDARSRDSGGTGLGLAIVKHIVERHRGTLDIRSTPGRGTDVRVWLPKPR